MQNPSLPILEVAALSQSKYSSLTRNKEAFFFHEQHDSMLDLSPGSSDMLKGQQHTGRLPLAEDRRQFHDCPSTAWMPSAFTETECCTL